MIFEIIGGTDKIETIATGRGIRELRRLRKAYGSGRWRKKKGVAEIRFENGVAIKAELHWYESAGKGKKEIKIKRILR